MATDVDIQHVTTSQGTASYDEACKERVNVSATDSGNNSPRMSWQESFSNLSRDLQMICGSSNNSFHSDGSSSSINEDCEVKQQTVAPTMTGVISRRQHSPAVSSSYQLQHQQHLPVIVCKPSPGSVHRPAPLNHIQARGDSPTSPCLRSPLTGARNSFPFPPVYRIIAPHLNASVGPAQSAQLRAGWRPVHVRHEETTDRLRQSLTKICLANSNNSSGNSSPSASSLGLQGASLSSQAQSEGPSVAPNAAPRHTDHQVASSAVKSGQLRLKESLKSGIRVRLDLTEVGCNSEYLIVSVKSDNGDEVSTAENTNRQLHVCNASASSESQLLTTVSLPQQTRVSTLSCYISEANTLYIRERDKDRMYIEVNPVNATLFLPVVQENEALLAVKIILHIADCFRFEDITVRTIDDRLIVRCGCNSVNGENSHDNLFTVVMSLPEGTYSRTVQAAYACKEHQLVISARRAPASRRMTCNF